MSEEKKKNRHAVALGRLGGKIGGKSKSAKKIAHLRSIAASGAAARWKHKREGS